MCAVFYCDVVFCFGGLTCYCSTFYFIYFICWIIYLGRKKKNIYLIIDTKDNNVKRQEDWRDLNHPIFMLC